jgi:hypothetical protein
MRLRCYCNGPNPADISLRCVSYLPSSARQEICLHSPETDCWQSSYRILTIRAGRDCDMQAPETK